jgi:two-component system response regulator AtoC
MENKARPGSMTVVVVTPGCDISHVRPSGTQLTVGRAADNDICIADPRLSRHHAVLHFGPHALVELEDLGSENGTHIELPATEAQSDDGPTLRATLRPVRSERFQVHHGALITLGGSRLIVTVDEPAAVAPDVAGWFDRSDRMRLVWELAARAARSQITVLLMGETGVGKEVLAEQIHRMSGRADHTFLRLNCAAFAENLLESELFGHERGAFTL